MKKTKPAGPTFRKGDLVRMSKRVRARRKFALRIRLPSMTYVPLRGFYLLNAEDRQEWLSNQKKKTDVVRPAPKHRWQALDEDGIYRVLRGRCRVEYNRHMLSGRVLILDTTTGRELYCERDILERVDKSDWSGCTTKRVRKTLCHWESGKCLRHSYCMMPYDINWLRHMWGYVQEQLVRSGDVHTVKAYKGGVKRAPNWAPGRVA